MCVQCREHWTRTRERGRGHLQVQIGKSSLGFIHNELARGDGTRWFSAAENRSQMWSQNEREFEWRTNQAEAERLHQVTKAVLMAVYIRTAFIGTPNAPSGFTCWVFGRSWYEPRRRRRRNRTSAEQKGRALFSDPDLDH